MRATLFDYGAGNLHSLARALSPYVQDLRIEADPLRALETDVLVLPGVGAFGAAAARLAPARTKLQQAIASGLPVLGICLGMQLLFDRSDEGPGEGLGVFPGRVTKLSAPRVPHMGWNRVEGSWSGWGYFAHSFACRPERPDDVVAWSSLEDERIAAIARRDRVLGVQFHPEKSAAPGRALLSAWFQEVSP